MSHYNVLISTQLLKLQNIGTHFFAVPADGADDADA